MNKQKAGGGIEWTHVFGEGTGYTWNPVGGCKHGCQWVMPDGQIAQCYAKTVAERVARAAYPQGFEAHYRGSNKRLTEPYSHKAPAGIFLDSMSDLMGAWVSDDEINAVLDICRQTPQHVYFLLTKNAPRLKKFDFPPNVWVGVSSPPDFMYGKQLTLKQRGRLLKVALKSLNATNASVRWVSFEPLTIDASLYLAQYRIMYRKYPIDWAVIGAASNGKKEYPPEERYVHRLVDELNTYHVPFFFKGNMRSLPWAVANWRQEFPSLNPGNGTEDGIPFAVDTGEDE